MGYDRPNGGGGALPPGPASAPGFPTEYDAIVNATATGIGDYIGDGRVVPTLAAALAYVDTLSLATPKIRIDQDISESAVSIPASIRNLQLYSELGKTFEGSFAWADTTSNIQRRFVSKGLTITEAVGEELFNFGNVNLGTVEVDLHDGQLNTVFPLMPGSAGDALTVIDIAMTDMIWEHDSAGQGGEPGIEFSSEIIPGRLNLIRTEVRVTSELQAALIKTHDTIANSSLFGTFEDCTFHGRYVPQGSVPTPGNNESIFSLNTDNDTNGGEPNWLFRRCTFTKSENTPFKIGDSTYVKLDGCTLDTTAALWAEVLNASPGGRIECVNTTINNVDQTAYETGLLVTFNPNTASSLVASTGYDVIVTTTLEPTARLFTTLQAAIDYSDALGLTEPRIRIDKAVAEYGVTIPVGITDLNLYSETLEELTTTMEWVNTGAGRHGVTFTGMKVNDGSTGDPLFNFNDFTSGEIDVRFDRSEIYTTIPLVGGTTAPLTSINVEAHNSVWTHNTGVEGESAFDLGNDVPTKFWAKNSSIRMPGTRYNSFFSIQAGFESSEIVIQLDNCNVDGNYFDHLTPPAAATNTTPIFVIDTDNDTIGGENNVRFNDCTFGRCYGPIVRTGTASKIEFNSCTVEVDTSVPNWATSQAAGGTIYWNNSVMKTYSPYQYDDVNVTVVFNPDYPAMATVGVNYDAIVNGQDNELGREFVGMQEALDYLGANAFTRGDVRIDINVAGNFTIPAGLNHLYIYSETYKTLDPGFTWADVTTSITRIISFNNLFFENNRPWMNFGDFILGAWNMELKGCGAYLDTELIADPSPLFTTILYNLTVENCDLYFAGAAGIEILEDNVNVSISVDQSTIRRAASNPNPIMEIGTVVNDRVTVRISNTSIEPEYAGTALFTGIPLFRFLSDDATVADNRTAIFQSCSISEIINPVIQVGALTHVDFFDTPIDCNSTSGFWAENAPGNTGGEINVRSSSFSGLNPYETESGIVLTVSPGLAYPKIATFIVSADAAQYPGDGDVFTTIQEGLDWADATGAGFGYITVGLPGWHTEADIVVPTSIQWLTMKPAGSGSFDFDQAACKANFLIDMASPVGFTLVLDQVVLAPPPGNTESTYFGDTTLSVADKVLGLYLRNNARLDMYIHISMYRGGAAANTGIYLHSVDSWITVSADAASPPLLETLSSTDKSSIRLLNTKLSSSGLTRDWFILEGLTPMSSGSLINISNCYIEMSSVGAIAADSGHRFLKSNQTNGIDFYADESPYVITNSEFAESFSVLFELGPNTGLICSGCTFKTSTTVAPNTEYWATVSSAGAGGTIVANNCVWTEQSPINYESGLNVTFNPDITVSDVPDPYDAIVTDQTTTLAKAFGTIQEAVNYCNSLGGTTQQAPHIRVDIEPTDNIINIPTLMADLHLHGIIKQQGADLLFRFANLTTGRGVHLYNMHLEISDKLFNYDEFTGGNTTLSLLEGSFLYNDAGEPIFGKSDPLATANISYSLIMKDSTIQHVEGGFPVFDIESSVNGFNVTFTWDMEDSLFVRQGQVDSPVLSASDGTVNERISIDIRNSVIAAGTEGAAVTAIPVFLLDSSWATGRKILFSDTTFPVIESPLFSLKDVSKVRLTRCSIGTTAPTKWATTATSGEIEVTGCSWTGSSDYDAALTVTLGSDIPSPV